MQNDPVLFNKQHRFVIAGLLAIALPAAGNTASDVYTWSAELVALDEAAKTVTVQSRLVDNADVELEDFDAGDRLTLTWSGITTAAGVRRVVDGPAPADDRLTLPIEFVSAERDNQYVRFTVAVPSADVAKLASLAPGSWITAISPRRALRYEEAVVQVRPYNDVG